MYSQGSVNLFFLLFSKARTAVSSFKIVLNTTSKERVLKSKVGMVAIYDKMKIEHLHNVRMEWSKLYSTIDVINGIFHGKNHIFIVLNTDTFMVLISK